MKELKQRDRGLKILSSEIDLAVNSVIRVDSTLYCIKDTVKWHGGGGGVQVVSINMPFIPLHFRIIFNFFKRQKTILIGLTKGV
jgi:hypothetical protein